jgi:hypothetical protein
LAMNQRRQDQHGAQGDDENRRKNFLHFYSFGGVARLR